MTFDTEEFTIDTTGSGVARLSGVLRLASPAAYEERFEPLRRRLEESNTFTVDVSGVRFLNSSGITWLSRLVLLARSTEKPILLIGSESISWHGKTLTLLKRLYAKVEVQLV